MATVYLPDADHVVRHVSGNLVERDPDTGEVVGCFPQAFALREGEPYLSASWLEHFPGTKDDRKKATVIAYCNTRTVRPKHGFAIGNVKTVKDACAEYSLSIRVCHEANKNPAYTAIRRYKSDEAELLELLASEAWSEVFEARPYLP